MTAGPLISARAALARGDVLIAYDSAISVIEADPGNLEAQFVSALALARAGATHRALIAATELLTNIAAAADAPTSLREDAAGLIARLAKDDALATEGSARQKRLREAANLYEAAAQDYGGFYTRINAATLRRLAGDFEHSRQLAEQALQLVRTGSEGATSGDYWRDATEAEAELLLGNLEEARRALARAVSVAGDDFASLAVTRRQLRLVCAAMSIDEAILDGLRPPEILHYCGHRIDLADTRSRFSPDSEIHIGREIRSFLAHRRIGFAYGSLASGADILVAEALIDLGIPLQIVLPFDTDEFERTSVRPGGPGWAQRFRSCLMRATSIVHTSDSSYMGDDELYGYAGRVAMGHALNHAAFLDAPAEQLAIWDQTPVSGVAGTSHDVLVWRSSGRETHVIALPPSVDSVDPVMVRAATRQIGAILFADFHGFSRLRDEHFPVFIGEVLGGLGAVLDAHAERVLWRNSWGDAIAAVFSDVTAAAACALALHDTLDRIDMAAIGLPEDLDLRVGAHAGPVMAIDDPVSHRRTYWGRELTRAARIEPRTPEGEVYVTDAFAALLSLNPDAPYATEYVGRVTTAKEFETIPMYRLRRR